MARYEYVASVDQDTEDPRGWEDPPYGTAIFRDGWTGRMTIGGTEEINLVPELLLFFKVYEQTWDVSLALRAANHYAGVYGTGNVVEIAHRYGYSQGDWWDMVTINPADADVYAQWLRGDVYLVTKYEVNTCDLGHDHKTLVDSLGGVYAGSEAEAIAYYREETGE